MTLKTILTLLSLFFTFNLSYADAYLKNNKMMHINANSLMDKLSFYATPITTPDQAPLKRFCSLPTERAKQYLMNKQKAAQSNDIAAYHYGVIVAFAPCLNNKTDEALTYLMKASTQGVTKANFMAGLILQNNQQISKAKTYFNKGKEAFHAESAYNLSIIETKQFLNLTNNDLKTLKIAANDGQDFIVHDLMIAELKLKLKNPDLIHKSNLTEIMNFLKEINIASDNKMLKNIAQRNLRTVSFINQTLFLSQKSFTQDKNLFASLKKQGLSNFNQYMENQ